jgi:2-keto-4-pentenoate hydratase/2-oxohepta-3-ene-1,7-dioic acid hydratase in catechol pathway
VRIMNAAGRLALLAPDGLRDVADLSHGAFGPDVQPVYERWAEFTAWARPLAAVGLGGDLPADGVPIGPPAPCPRQIFAIGLNYRDHAEESHLSPPEAPAVFTKFVTCLTGPHGELPLPSDFVDWEVELVVTIGRHASHVPAADGWSYVAGLSVGQDFSERMVQLAGPAPQFSLGKSFPCFGPIGPWLVTPDELANPDDLEIECCIDGESVQKARTSAMIFGVAELIARLSAVTPLLPGDVIFTGTPSGIGGARTPPRFLRPGQVVESGIAGIGELRQICVPPQTHQHQRARKSSADNAGHGFRPAREGS